MALGLLPKVTAEKSVAWVTFSYEFRNLGSQDGWLEPLEA